MHVYQLLACLVESSRPGKYSCGLYRFFIAALYIRPMQLRLQQPASGHTLLQGVSSTREPTMGAAARARFLPAEALAL